MKEKYESLSLATLKDLAKARGLKGISTMRKPELIERMLEEDRKEQTAENKQTISGTAEENTIPARPEPVAAEKTSNLPEGFFCQPKSCISASRKNNGSDAGRFHPAA